MCATFKLDRNTSYAASHHKEKKREKNSWD